MSSAQICPVTVAIPEKDRIEDLREAVSSVFAQTLLPREVIIVDDCSRVPVTADLLPPVPDGITMRILRNDPNLGGAKSLNRAVEAATSPYISFLDSDDCFLPTYLEKVMAVWNCTGPETVCVGTGFYWCTENLVPYRIHRAQQNITRRDLLTQGNIVGGSSVLSVRRDQFLVAGGYPLCRGSHDWGMLLNMSTVGKIEIIPEPLLLYRSPSTNSKPTYTKSYRSQIVALSYIVRTQPPADRPLIRRRTRKLILDHLARMGRKRMACKILYSSWQHHGKMSPFLWRSLFIIAAGPQLYDHALRYYAKVRAGLFGKKFLAARNIA